MTQGFALYRLPYARDYKRVAGAVRTFPSLQALSSQQGFVIAPFAATAERPILLIEPDGNTAASDAVELPSIGTIPNDDGRENYHIDFLIFHAHLKNGDFQKLVLSRSTILPKTSADDPMTLFHRACQLYPRMFVALVYTPQSGMWLTATPETLLSGIDGRWQTMALAGTMPWSDEVLWSDKNLQEQRYVATYITRQLEHFTSDFTEDGPYTARAGHLAHLRSDFRFTLLDSARMGDLLYALHPTPAVCGLPKHKAFSFILRNEHHERTYYSGLMGPLALNGKTHLFVTLRCMQLFADAYKLYAGGGLLCDSKEEQEWQETETKMDTMRRVVVETE